jgi:2-polyprenyl-3-methyl-5-hydroxy-6-metoxy-1,4-benzoquinol methylase
MRSIHCAICNNKENTQELYNATFDINKITHKTFSARRTPDRIHYRFVTCKRCSLIFSNPILPQNKIEHLYAKSTFTYSIESNYLKKTYGQYLMPLLKNYPLEKTKLLDIGCGNGFFLEEAKERGVGSVFGIEPGIASVKKAPKWLQNNIKIGILQKGSFKDNSFDIICCFHTLDHIVDPNSFLETVYAFLKKGGKALFIVHDTNGLSVKLFSEKSPIFDIEHIYLFNKKSLEAIFKKNKFRVIQTFSVKNTYPILYWTRILPLPNKMKALLLSFLQNTKIGSIPISLKAGNIGIVVQK